MSKKKAVIRGYVIILLSVLLLIWSLVTVAQARISAAGFDDINSPEVFLKQESKRTCTLASTAMMLRRAAILNGNENWREITQEAIRPTAWVEGTGIKWEFTYYGISVKNETLKGDHTETLKKLLEEHPEGIVVYHYSSQAMHAVLLTDYTDGVFYCSDPAVGYPDGRIPLSQAYGVTLENIMEYWYVTSPKCELSVNDSSVNSNTADNAANDSNDVSIVVGVGLGDVNLDGAVNATDATLILQEFASIITPEEDFEVDVADVDSSGMINATDATLVLQYFSHIISEFQTISI